MTMELKKGLTYVVAEMALSMCFTDSRAVVAAISADWCDESETWDQLTTKNCAPRPPPSERGKPFTRSRDLHPQISFGIPPSNSLNLK